MPSVIERLERLLHQRDRLRLTALGLPSTRFERLGKGYRGTLRIAAERAFECVMGKERSEERPTMFPLIQQCWECGAALGSRDGTEGFEVVCGAHCGVVVTARDYLSRCVGGAPMGVLKEKTDE